MTVVSPRPITILNLLLRSCNAARGRRRRPGWSSQTPAALSLVAAVLTIWSVANSSNRSENAARGSARIASSRRLAAGMVREVRENESPTFIVMEVGVHLLQSRRLAHLGES